MAQKTKKQARRSRATTPAEPPGWHTRWERLPGGVRHAICLAFLLLVSLVFFAPIHFTGKSLVPSDITGWRATAASMIEYREATGETVLWATHPFAGMPGYFISPVRQIPQIDDLPALLRSFLWPTSHFLVLLGGCYLLVFFLTRNRLSGVLTACAFGLTTYIPVILSAGHNSKFIALAFAPWLILTFIYAVRRPGLLASLFFAIALAANLRAGHPQITYDVALLLGIWWLVEGIVALRKSRGAAFAASTGWMALGAVLALLMVAHPYLAQYEFKAYSIRGAASGGAPGTGGIDWSYAMGWSQGAWELLTLLIADIFGGASPDYWGPKAEGTGGPHYVGGIVLALATFALIRERKPYVWALGGGALLMILFSLGANFPLLNRFMFDYFPLFDAWRVPETWLSVVALVLAVLAGVGLYAVVRPAPAPEAEGAKTRTLYAVFGSYMGLVAILLFLQGAFFSFERAGEYEQVQAYVAEQLQQPADSPQVLQATRQVMEEQVRGPRMEAFRGDAIRTLMVLVVAGIALLLFRRGTLPGWTVQTVLVLAVVLDLAGVGRRYVNADRLVEVDAVEETVPTYDFDRFLIEQVEAAGGPGHFRVLSLEGSPAVAARPAYHYETLSGYTGAKLRLYQDYLEHILPDPETGLPNNQALDLLNTRYVAAGRPFPGMEVVYRGEQFVVSENTDALPRAFFVGETEVIESAEATWERLQNEAFDPARTALLPAPIDFETTPLDSTSTATATLESYEPHEIVWQVETDAPRLLVVSEIYYPAGWTAEIDGEEVPIYRADYLLRAVPVPAGSHTLTMRFAPRSYRLGLWLSGASAAFTYGAVLVLLGLAYVRRRSDAGPDAPSDGTPDDDADPAAA